MSDEVTERRWGVDIEPTNRCNASCHFCPRDQTPHQGLMSRETFEQALARACEMKPLGEGDVNLCGLGEPLLNKLTPLFAGRIRDEGLRCAMSSNAALLDERRGNALLEAGLDRVFINVGDIGKGYEDVYKLPFDKTLANIKRFAQDAEGTCKVVIVLVDYKGKPEHTQKMKKFWRGHGLRTFMQFNLMNRGGALFVDHMQYEQFPERAAAEALVASRTANQTVCTVPFNSVFIGYDGQYYLCCSDWKKEVPLGSVFDESVFSVLERKLGYVMSREPICKTCNLDPVNQVMESLRALDAGEISEDEHQKMVDMLQDLSTRSVRGIEKFHAGAAERARKTADLQLAERRPLIPLSVV
jgi:MoaA/NifB/PqqE/SkfB family radical SAM enzyme